MNPVSSQNGNQKRMVYKGDSISHSLLSTSKCNSNPSGKGLPKSQGRLELAASVFFSPRAASGGIRWASVGRLPGISGSPG